MKNPLIYLFQKMWLYSKGNRKNVIFYIVLSVLATLTLAIEPLILGLFLNTIQINGVNQEILPRLFLILSLLFFLEISIWTAHGPSRVMETTNAFLVRKNYKNYLLKGIMALPIEWHTDHHSGDTIDKIEKGTEALFNFSKQSFQVIRGIINLITAFAVMFYPGKFL